MKNEAKMGIYFAKNPMFLAKKSRYVHNRFQTFLGWFLILHNTQVLYFQDFNRKICKENAFPQNFDFCDVLTTQKSRFGSKKAEQ